MIEKSLRLIGTSPQPSPARDRSWQAASRSAAPQAGRQQHLVPLFAATLFLSALLLFLVQPLVGKMMLPNLGGAPAVWNTCMVFFQGLLLAGYAYAHVATKRLGTGRHALLHGALMLLPFAVLPIAADAGASPPTADHPGLWLLTQLALWVGLPFFVISTTAPLLQPVVLAHGARDTHDPYFLYGASNLGSLAALVAYPTLVEPLANLSRQSELWAIGYALLVVLTGACGLAAWRAERGRAEYANAALPAAAGGQATGLTLRRRAYWVFAAFVPSSLMLGATTHITTDLAPMPLLWVVPLALYMLTFVIVFARKPLVTHQLVRRLLPLAILPACLLACADPPLPGAAMIPIHLGAFFWAALACHGALAADRPAADRLTEFYLWMSVGGVLGGMLNALVAPVVFNREFGAWLWLGARAGPLVDGLISPIFLDKFVEYPAAMLLAWVVVACGRRGGRQAEAASTAAGRTAAGAAFGWLAPVGILAVTWVTYRFDVNAGGPRVVLSLMLPGLLCLTLVRRPAAFAVAVALMLGCVSLHTTAREGELIYAGRNFFGGKRVHASVAGFHLFYHGQTSHGFQNMAPAMRGEPLAYYHRSGPAGDIFMALAGEGGNKRVALVGLGVGAMAAYSRPGDRFTFYEIDPQVDRVAGDPALFTFLEDGRGDCEVVLGDGRLRLAEQADGAFDLIVLDAFSSDAIPTHLLTREAVALYESKLSRGGRLVFHVSNNYLDLVPLLGRLGQEAQLVAAVRRDVNIPLEDLEAGRSPCEYVALARDRATLATLGPGWAELTPDPNAPAWTDDFSNILSVLRW